VRFFTRAKNPFAYTVNQLKGAPIRQPSPHFLSVTTINMKAVSTLHDQAL
jgi:hypothetical protein